MGGHAYSHTTRDTLVTDGTRSFSWNAANALTSTSGPYANTSYAYDAHGWRIKRQRTGQYPEYYVYNRDHQLLLSWDGGTSRATEYVHLGNLIVAKLHRLATQYILPDWHGSPLIVTNPWGGVSATPIYLGYGRTDANGRQQIPGYTGAVMDENTGATYLGARYLYHKRFTSPDPAPLNPLSPVGLNRYAYANDNPVRFTDPDGRRSKVAWLVRLTAKGMKKVARLTREQAIEARRAEKNVVADRRQIGNGIEGAAQGSKGRIKHAGHELKDGSKGLPHYQTKGKSGHTFWGKISVAAASLAGALDQVAEAAEYIPDPVPRPAAQGDIDRANSVIDAISDSTGIPLRTYPDIPENRPFPFPRDRPDH